VLPLFREDEAMRRMPVIDDKLSNLIVERDSVRIRMSLLGDQPSVDPEEMIALRSKARELEELISAHQRTI
jgi:hypothetical protein